MASRAFEHLVLFTVATSLGEEETDEKQIVLVAWLILSTSKNQVVAKEQVLVCPSQGAPAQKDLPAGIRADAVQSAKTMAVVLKQFQTTLGKIGNSFCLLTAGPLPLRNLLHPEMHRAGIPLQKHLCRYFDICAEFSQTFPNVQSTSTLEEICDTLGISVGSSEPKYGLGELKMVSDITQKLISQGHVFDRPEVIHEECNYSAIVNPSQVLEGCVVRLRGLPFQASLKEVAGFLAGVNCIPGGLVFGINAVGRRTGEALVALESPEQAELVQKRHKHYLDQRYIEVYEATREDFLHYAGSGGGGGSSGDDVAIVRMQGLPYRASEEDIVEFFGPDVDVKDGEDGVLIVRFSDGRASGDAFTVFKSENEMKKALEKDRTSMGSRYVELFRSSVKEFQLVLNRSGSLDQQQHFTDMLGLVVDADSDGDGLRGRERNCVKLRGLPWSANPEDIIKFFGELKDDICTHGVHMVLNAMNRPTGDCYVQLKSVDAASTASEQLHKQYIGNRYIEVFQCSGDEVAHALLDSGGGRSSGSYRGGGGGGGGGGGREGGRRRQGSGGAVVKARGLPFSTTEYELAGFFEEYDVKERDVEIVYNHSGRSIGIGYVTFSSRSQAQQAITEKDGKHIGHRYVELSMN